MKASDVTPTAVDWLWYPFLPLGKLSMVAGQMGQAKSLFSVWLTAAVTRGEGLNLTRPGHVVLFSAEDDPGDTTAPRLLAAGADLDRVWIEEAMSINADQLAEQCSGGDVRLIVIDPVGSYWDGTDSWKPQEVRKHVEPLRQLAADHKVCVLFVQHLNRRREAAPLERIADSQALAQVCRSVLVWGPDPADPEGDHGPMKALTRAKSNLARASASATFTIEERQVTNHIKAPALTRGDDRNITSEDVVGDAQERSAQDEAADFLQHLLADGPMNAQEVRNQAQAAGISNRTLDRAKRKAGVISSPARENGEKFTGWQWELRQPQKRNGVLGNVGALGDVDQSAQDAKNAKNAHTATPPEAEAA
jgi:putative DNA primase/helicase